MKKRIKALFSSILCLCLCITATMPAYAANENNGQGVTFSAVLEPASIQVSDQEQTVIMRVTAGEAIDLVGIGGNVTSDEALTISAITNDDSRISFSTDDIYNGKLSWSTADLSTLNDVTDIAAVTFTVPANTPAGDYTVGMNDIEIVAWDESTADYVTWESAANVSATLTITEAAISDGYTAGVSAAVREAAVDEQISVTVNVEHIGDTVFTAGEIVINYDSTKLAFNENASTLNEAAAGNEAATGTLKLEHYGKDKPLGDAAYTLVFDAVSAGATTVTLNSAAFGDSVDAEKSNLTPATISTASVALTISEKSYAVTLPEIFAGPSTVQPGASYTFTVADGKNYDYSDIKATMGGNEAEVIDNGDGSYTIASVTGDLVITGTRTEKSYSATVTGTGAADITDAEETATYGSDYVFTMPTAEGYTYSLDSITIDGKAYTGYSVSGSVYTIPGTAVAGDIVITVSKIEADDGKVEIKVEGTGAGAAEGYDVTADKGSDYTLTLVPESGCSYTVTATMGGEPADVKNNGDNTYTIENVNDDIVFTVEKVVKTDGVSVAEYLTLDGSVMWLLKNETTLEAGKVPTYDGANMFWSDKYNAYCWLTVGDTLTADEAKNKVGIADGTAEEVDYDMDVNKTGKVDANDAQLTYNMYNAKYEGFTDDVTAEKYLSADVNGDGKVNTEDAAAIIAGILGN